MKKKKQKQNKTKQEKQNVKMNKGKKIATKLASRPLDHASP